MRVKFTVLSLTMLLSSVTFAWGFFGPSAKDVENAFIERWAPTTRYILGWALRDKLEMKSVKATKTERTDIWKVTYMVVEPYAGRKDAAQNKDGVPNVKSQQKGGKDTAQGKQSERRSIFDLLDDDEANTEIKYKRVSYVSVCSVHKRDGKLELKFMPVPADLN